MKSILTYALAIIFIGPIWADDSAKEKRLLEQRQLLEEVFAVIEARHEKLKSLDGEKKFEVLFKDREKIGYVEDSEGVRQIMPNYVEGGHFQTVADVTTYPFTQFENMRDESNSAHKLKLINDYRRRRKAINDQADDKIQYDKETSFGKLVEILGPSEGELTDFDPVRLNKIIADELQIGRVYNINWPVELASLAWHKHGRWPDPTTLMSS